MPSTRSASEPRPPAVRLPPAPELEQTEAFLFLKDLARNKAGNIPAEILARQVMRITEGGDWPLRRAAMDALLRRYDSARRDRLRVAMHPRGKGGLGKYRTARPRGDARPYDTVLQSVEPFRGSCNCPDFLSGSLGVCKHLLVVLDELAARPRKFQRPLRASERTTDGENDGGAWAKAIAPDDTENAV